MAKFVGHVKAALSDVAGSDIATHGNRQRALTEVRNWLNNQARLNADGPARIWNRFNDFMVANFDTLTLRGFSPRDIETTDGAELISQMRAWIAAHP